MSKKKNNKRILDINGKDFPRVFKFEKVNTEVIECGDLDLSLTVEERKKKSVKSYNGYATVFDHIYEIGDFWREVIRKGAFTKTLSESDQVSLWSHNQQKPLGRKSENTLVLEEDNYGLFVENELPNTTWGMDAYTSIKRGDVQGMSMGFWVVKEVWHFDDDDKDDMPLREIKEINLLEVSPVVFPANPITEIQVRSALLDIELRGILPVGKIKPNEKDILFAPVFVPSVWNKDIDAEIKKTIWYFKNSTTTNTNINTNINTTSDSKTHLLTDKSDVTINPKLVAGSKNSSCLDGLIRRKELLERRLRNNV